MPINSRDEMLKDAYRHIQLYPDSENLDIKNDSMKERQYKIIRDTFKPCVSFNTVPSFMVNSNGIDGDDGLEFPGVQIPPEYTMEEFYDDESGFVSDNTGYFLRNNYVTDRGSRGSSPPPRAYRSTKAMLSSMFKIAENGKIVRVDYPSKPTILNDAIIVNRAQPNWHGLWVERRNKIDSRVQDKAKYFKYPDSLFPPQPTLKASFISEDGFTPVPKEQRRKEKILHKKIGYPNTPRTILCHISGRRHTWVALDWTIRELAQDTDHIVVIANLPKFARTETNGRRSSTSSLNWGDFENDVKPRSLSVDASVARNNSNPEWTAGYRQDVIVEKLLNLLTYISLIIPKKISIKVTVEIVIGKIKKVMTDALNVYTPDFCVSSTLKWARNDNLILWKSKCLTDVLCTKFPVPVFVAPSRRMWSVEAKLQNSFEPTSDAKSARSSSLLEESSDSEKSARKENVIFPSVDSFSPSSACVDSFSESEVSDLEDESSAANVKEKLILFSKVHARTVLKTLKDIENDKDSTHIERQMKKLDYIVAESIRFSSKVEDISKEHSEEDRELDYLKRVITGGTEAVPNFKKSMLDVGNHPRAPSNKKVLPKARKGAIKFAPTVNQNDGIGALGRSKLKTPEPRHSSAIRSLSPIRQSKSINLASGPDEGQGSNNIRKVRSSNSIYRTRSNDSVISDSSAKKKSGSGFLSIFRSSARSRSTSRRNSSGSESDRTSMSSDSSRKRRSRLFGFS